MLLPEKINYAEGIVGDEFHLPENFPALVINISEARVEERVDNALVGLSILKAAEIPMVLDVFNSYSFGKQAQQDSFVYFYNNGIQLENRKFINSDLHVLVGESLEWEEPRYTTHHGRYAYRLAVGIIDADLWGVSVNRDTYPNFPSTMNVVNHIATTSGAILFAANNKAVMPPKFANGFQIAVINVLNKSLDGFYQKITASEVTDREKSGSLVIFDRYTSTHHLAA